MYPVDAYVRVNNGLSNNRFINDVVPQLKKSFYNFSDNLLINNEIIYQQIPAMSKYRDSHILIMGGGASLLEFDFNLDEYDYIWSMNGCYFNENIKNNGVDLIVVGCNTDIKSNEFLLFINKYSPIVAFELHCKYYLNNPELNFNIESANSLIANKICFQTKWYSQLGTGVREFILACAMSPKQISFIGFDGRRDIKNDKHAFITGNNWKNQNIIPGSIRGFNNQQITSLMKMEYDKFWQYIHRTFPNIKINNLDKKNDYHELC